MFHIDYSASVFGNLKVQSSQYPLCDIILPSVNLVTDHDVLTTSDLLSKRILFTFCVFNSTAYIASVTHNHETISSY